MDLKLLLYDKNLSKVVPETKFLLSNASSNQGIILIDIIGSTSHQDRPLAERSGIRPTQAMIRSLRS